MKTTVTFDYFVEAFNKMGRGNQFTFEGLELLFDYLNHEYAEIEGNEYELDVIQLCCDFTECRIEDVLEDFTDLDLSGLTKEEKKEAITEYLSDLTSVAGWTSQDTIIYQSF